MSDAEVATVAKIMLTADGWCTNCSGDLLNQLDAAFPGHSAMIDSVRKSGGDLRRLHYENVNAFSEGASTLKPVWEL